MKMVSRVWKPGGSICPYTLGKIFSARASFKKLEVMVGDSSQMLIVEDPGTALFAFPSSRIQ
jgi:hypothetical protein